MPTLRPILVAACALTFATAAPAAPDDTARIASEAYIFGYPLVLMNITEDVSRARAGLNQFIHLRESPRLHFPRRRPHQCRHALFVLLGGRR